MPTVRELITRFGFEIDEEPVKRLDRMLTGTRRTLMGVAGALGVGLGLRSLVEFGLAQDRAVLAAQRWGAQIDKSGKFAGEMGKRIGELKTQYENFNDVQAASAYAAFQRMAQGFPAIEGKFLEFLDKSALMAKAGAGKFDEVFSQLLQAGTTGNFEFLTEIPGITAEVVGRLRKMFNIASGAFFIPESQRGQFMQQLFGTLDDPQIRQQLERDAKHVAESGLGDAQAVQTALEEAAQKLGKLLVEKLQPAMVMVTEFLERINQSGGSARDVVTAIAEKLGMLKQPIQDADAVWTKLQLKMERLAAGAAIGAVGGMALKLPPMVGALLGVGAAKLAEDMQDWLVEKLGGDKKAQAFIDAITGKGPVNYRPIDERNEGLEAPGTGLSKEDRQNYYQDMRRMQEGLRGPRAMQQGYPPQGREDLPRTERDRSTSATQIRVERGAIQINGAVDPRAVAEEVERQLRAMLDNAARQFMPVEGVG